MSNLLLKDTGVIPGNPAVPDSTETWVEYKFISVTGYSRNYFGSRKITLGNVLGKLYKESGGGDNWVSCEIIYRNIGGVLTPLPQVGDHGEFDPFYGSNYNSGSTYNGSALVPNPNTYFLKREVVHNKLIPGTPAGEPSVDFKLGWNAGAHSIVSYVGAVVAKFKVRGVGIACGLAQDTGVFDPPVDYNFIHNGFRMTDGKLYVMHDGASWLIGDLVPNIEYQIVRTQRPGYSNFALVEYFANSTLVWSDFSDTYLQKSYLAAVLYSGGDAVNDPSLVPIQASAIKLPVLAAKGAEGDYADGGDVNIWFDVVGSEVGDFLNVMQVPIYAKGSEEETGDPAFDLDPPTPTGPGGNGDPGPSYPGPGSGGVPGPGLSNGSGVMGLKITAAVDPMPNTGDAQLFLLATGYMDFEVMDELVLIQNDLAGTPEILIVMDQTNAVAAVLAVDFVRDAVLDVGVTAGVSLLSALQLDALISTVLNIGDAPGVGSEGNRVYVLNTETSATSMYEAFPFNSFARLGGMHFGARPEGVFELEGDDDDGDPIAAAVNFGRFDFGTSMQKHVPYAYMGVSSDGDLYLRVQVLEQSWTYKARTTQADLNTQRVDFGKGLKGVYYTFELLNDEGSSFELENIEFVAMPLNRRI